MQTLEQWSAEVEREIEERTGLRPNEFPVPYMLYHQDFSVMQAVAHALGYPYLPRDEKIDRMALAMARADAVTNGQPTLVLDRMSLDSRYYRMAEAALDALGRFGGEF
jgi:hypothetical protein